MKDIGLKNFTTEVIKSKEPVLVTFYHDDCIQCKRINPTLALVGKVLKVNVTTEPELAKHFKIIGVPTMIFFKNGQEQLRTMGLRSAQQLIEVLDTI